MKILLWRLYYEDGSVFDASDGEPWESPELGLICIGQPCARGEYYDRLHNGRYFLYRLDLGYWIECDLTGLEDQLSAYPCRPLRRGRLTTTTQFKEICNRMLKDLDAS